LRIDQFAGTFDLGNLFSLASALRQLAGDSLCCGDQALYLLTAEALEKRAEWIAFTYPQVGGETIPQDHVGQADSPGLHKPVDVTI
jgi:hypothetical protein